VLAGQILANLVLETEAVRLVAILTLSHHAVLVFAVSRLEGVFPSSLFGMIPPSPILTLLCISSRGWSLLCMSSSFPSSSELCYFVFLLRAILSAIFFCWETPWGGQVSSATTSVLILLQIVPLGDNVCQLSLHNLDIVRCHCVKDLMGNRQSFLECCRDDPLARALVIYRLAG
jgi:hypothetical protein